MRRFLHVGAAVLVASVAMLVIVPVTTATSTPTWFQAKVVLVAHGSSMQFNAWVTNTGTITHTGTLSLTTNFGVIRAGTLTLAPGQTWMSGAYLDAVAGADAAIGRVVAALPARTTVIVTADHGGHVNNHGTTDPQDMTIPWIVNGPGVVPHALTRRVNTTDTAATALWVLGLRTGAGATGTPVSEAFTTGMSPARLTARAARP